MSRYKHELGTQSEFVTIKICCHRPIAELKLENVYVKKNNFPSIDKGPIAKLKLDKSIIIIIIIIIIMILKSAK